MHVYRGPRPATRKFANLELRGIALDGTFSGYASVFGEVDLGKDVIERGAFRRSIEERGASGIRMLYQHDPAQPIGTWHTIREDERGLYVEGTLTPRVARAQEVHALIKTGALDGLSIGFQTVRAGKAGTSGVRRILEADLWEISIVTFALGHVPAAGAAVRAGFEFDVPVRFDIDRIDVSLATFEAGRIPSIPLVEILP